MSMRLTMIRFETSVGLRTRVGELFASMSSGFVAPPLMGRLDPTVRVGWGSNEEPMRKAPPPSAIRAAPTKAPSGERLNLAKPRTRDQPVLWGDTKQSFGASTILSLPLEQASRTGRAWR